MILIRMPCYRLNGDLWCEMRPLTAAVVGYHLSVRSATFEHCCPPHAVDAINAYRDTLQSLLESSP